MTTLEEAWRSRPLLLRPEAEELHASGAGAEVLQDVLRHARELLAVLDEDLVANRLDMPDDDRNALEQLRAEEHRPAQNNMILLDALIGAAQAIYRSVPTF